MGTTPRFRRLSVAVVAAAAVLAGCSGGGSHTGGSAADGGPGHTTYPPGKRQAAPALSGTTIAGTAYDPARTAGKVTVVNFWASWCGPCKAETDGLVGVAKKYPQVAFVGVDEDHAATKPASAFAAAHRVSYPSLWDKNDDVAAAWAVSGLPFTFVLDGRGKVAARWIGAVTPAGLTAVLNSELRR